MKGKHLIVLLLACVLSFALAFSASAQVSDGYTGWEYDFDMGYEVYYNNGEKVTNDWIVDGDHTYYVDENGLKYNSDIYEIDGVWYGFSWEGYLYDDTVFFTQEYDETLGHYVETHYCAKPGGELYRNGWAKPTHSYIEGALNDRWFYAGEDHAVLTGKQLIGGKYYCFEHNGAMYYDEYFEHYNEETDDFDTYYAQGGAADGALAQNRWVWNTDQECWNYYDDDCIRVKNRIVTIGGKLYGFDWNGEMYYDTVFSIYNAETDDWDYYRAMGGSADGALLVNSWNQSYIADGNTDWYYYGADGKQYRNGVKKIGNKYYYFHGWGNMAEGEFSPGYYDEELDTYISDGYYRTKADGSLYVNEWFTDGDTWYYYGAEGKAPFGLATIGGKQYCFTYWGRMLENDVESIMIDGVMHHYIADKEGAVVEAENDDWTKAFGRWYLVLNDEFCRSEIRLVGDEYYGFDWQGKMYENEFFDMDRYGEDDEFLGWFHYYAKADGTLARNEVVSVNWYYGERLCFFGDDCAAPEEEGLYTLGDAIYYVYSEGEVLTSDIMQTEDGVYRFEADGAGRKLADGWYYDDTDTYEDAFHYWIYVQDGQMFADGIYEIGGKRYAFEDNCALITDDIYYDWQTEKYWLLTYMDKSGRGGSVCEETNVWKTVNGEYVYLTEDSSLYTGWMDKYYLEPYMSYCEYIADDDNYVYAVNKYGVANKLNYTGLLATNGANGYLRNGKIVMDEWIKFSDGWRYFDGDGCMLVDEAENINDVWYYFDHNGRMCDNGWHRSAGGSWYWAAKSGALFTGIDSVGYVFNSSGRLIEDDVAYIDGVFYVTDRNGKKIGTFTEDGWNKVGSNWYYAVTYDYDIHQSREVMRGSYYDEFGRFFAFDSQGRMLANRFYEDNTYYLGSNGNALKNWFKIDGYWYYGDPDDYGRLYRSGICYIGDKEFSFDETGRLLVNKTFFYWGEDCIVTTNGNGEVINKTPANGWAYSENAMWGYGEAYYYKNGSPYTGWIGNYYIDGGWMAINTTVMDEKTGKEYCLNKKGLKVTSNWYELWEDEWVLARADGSLYRNEWVKSGGKWYYFEGSSMVYDRILFIDGAWHEFDKNGVWIGEYTENAGLDFSGKNDGWVKHNGQWYFSMAGEPVRNDSLLVDGKWYAFDSDGVMIANAFNFTYYGKSFGVYYYTASGARGEYTGWKYIGKDWVYFNKANLACEGWILDGGKYYYQEFVAADNDYSFDVVGARMVTGYHVINDVLYYFNGSGILTKTITASGWHQAGSDWYYVDANGKVVSGQSAYKIGGSRYAFDYDGKMIANDISDGQYYNANGALITKSGWYTVNGKWIYVLSNGKVAGDGVFRIDGKDYYFHEYIWVG